MKHIRARRALEMLHRAALSGVDPEGSVARALASPVVRRALASSSSGRIGVFAAGKAAAGMARAALAELGDAPALVVLPRGHSARGLPRSVVVLAAHPEPDAASLRAGRRAIRFFGSFGQDDTILCLLSGGASSLLAAPREGVTLAQKRRLIRELARTGAPIEALNRLRIKLSAIKGGRLGRSTAARIVTLVLSDVPGDRAALVGSGPTVRGRRRDLVRIVGTNRSGLEAAAREARRIGLKPVLEPRRIAGDAARAGRRLARRAATLRPGSVLLAGGETTVSLKNAAPRGRGGRCLELALGAAQLIRHDRPISLLAAGSDGLDGNSGAAGAFADGSTVRRARARGIEPAAALVRHDTRRLFAALGDLFVTGPTGTNVGDWVFLLRA
ncbi:MAG: DUF4147 domain-containing protein [Thermoanaerobaculia bacterium]